MQRDAPHKTSLHYDATGCSTWKYPCIMMQQNVPHKNILVLRCNRMSHIKISLYYNAPNVAHQDILILRCYRCPHKDNDYSAFVILTVQSHKSYKLTAAKFKPLVFPMLSPASSNVPNIVFSDVPALWADHYSFQGIQLRLLSVGL